MLGSLMLPVMLARGYHPTIATGPIMAIGAVDMLIPPSALTVLLGSLSGISISKLLIGGVLPGILLSISFVAWIIIRVKISPHLAPQETNLVHHKGWARWQPFFAYVLPTLSIFGVVVGALAAGWATPTECAALGAFATMVLASFYRVLKWDAVLKSLKGTAGISGMIVLLWCQYRLGAIHHWSRLVHRLDCGGHDANAHLLGNFCRPSQHDDDHLAHFHAHRDHLGNRPYLVWRHVPHLHAIGLAVATSWLVAHDHARCCTTLCHHGPHLFGCGTLRRHEFDFVVGRLLHSRHCHMAAWVDRLIVYLKNGKTLISISIIFGKECKVIFKIQAFFFIGLIRSSHVFSTH